MRSDWSEDFSAISSYSSKTTFLPNLTFVKYEMAVRNDFEGNTNFQSGIILWIPLSFTAGYKPLNHSFHPPHIPNAFEKSSLFCIVVIVSIISFIISFHWHWFFVLNSLKNQQEMREINISRFGDQTGINTLQEHHLFRTKMTISILSDLLKSMGGVFLGFSPKICEYLRLLSINCEDRSTVWKNCVVEFCHK